MGEKGKCPSNAENIETFTKQWFSAMNRGGLFVVSDEVYLFSLRNGKENEKNLIELI